jgi:hypothetical protein
LLSLSLTRRDRYTLSWLLSIDAGPGVQSRARISSYRGAATFQDHDRIRRGLVPAITPCMSFFEAEVARRNLSNRFQGRPLFASNIDPPFGRYRGV